MPDGIVHIITRALSPITHSYISLARSLDIDLQGVPWERLPILITSNVEELTIGVISRIKVLLKTYDVPLGSSVDILPGDIDLHPAFRFSCAFEVDSTHRFAHKSRNPDCELFLDRLVRLAQLEKYFFVPHIRHLNSVGYWQEFVATSIGDLIISDELLFAMGRFAALAQLLGANDFHEENVIFDGRRFAIIDGETLFQSLTRFRDTGRAHSNSVLTSHVLTVLPSRVVGCYTRVLLKQSFSKQMTDAGVMRQTELIKAGYRSGFELKNLILAEIPSTLCVRNVFMPTAAYAGIVARESPTYLHSSRAALSQRLQSVLTQLNDCYQGPVDAAAGELASSFIPFYQCYVTEREMKAEVQNAAVAFQEGLRQNEEILEEHASIAMRS